MADKLDSFFGSIINVGVENNLPQHKRKKALTPAEKIRIQHYLDLHPDLQTAYDIKEAYQAWFDTNKRKERRDVRQTLHDFYQLVRDTHLPEFIKAIGTFSYLDF
ncbi:transposase [Listeria booriae]|uniref:transposase n=1 Tax=Listeria booriae TaxID=1552123 RepID=UPI002892C17C|nr:transposase [Listeria booriae]